MDKNQSALFSGKNAGQIINTPSPLAKSAFFYVQEAGSASTDKVRELHGHSMDSFLIALIVSGSGKLTAGAYSYELSAGDCFFIDCREHYICSSSDIDPWKIMWVHFNGATSKQYYEYFSGQGDCIFRPQFFDKAVSAVSSIIKVNSSKDPSAEVLTSKLIVDLLTLALTVRSSSENYDSALKQKLAAVNAYISDHFTEDLSLEKISSEFYISKYYLTREYKKIYGKTIFQHIISCRISYGKELLRYSDKSVDEIAHLCGFNDQSYFVRQFKKSENVTCFAYRRMWRDNL